MLNGGAVLLEGEEENLGTLHWAIQWRVTVDSDTHFNMQIIITLRALRPALGRPQHAQRSKCGRSPHLLVYFSLIRIYRSIPGKRPLPAKRPPPRFWPS